MNARRLRKARQEMHGYFDTESYRVPSGGPDPFTAREWPTSSIRVRIGSSGRARPWRAGL